MSSAVTAAPTASQKVNLRRPDVMEAVQALVVSHYRSHLVDRIRAGGGVIHADGLTIKLAKEFGFCYGVERAIDLAYAARNYFPPPRRIFLLGEIIHNPEVNDQIRGMGIVSISPRPTTEELGQVNAEDVVIIPAFGTEVAYLAVLARGRARLADATALLTALAVVAARMKWDILASGHGVLGALLAVIAPYPWLRWFGLLILPQALLTKWIREEDLLAVPLGAAIGFALGLLARHFGRPASHAAG